MTTYQVDVRRWHRAMGLLSPDTHVPFNAATLAMRKRLVTEEANEAANALEAGDLVGLAGELCDVLFVSLGSFDTCGLVADARFVELIETGAYHTRRGLERCASDVAWIDSHAQVFAATGDLNALNQINKRAAHAFGSLGIDPRPLWAAVCEANMSKAPPVIDGSGKFMKGPNYRKHDLGPLLLK